jgi:sodium/bile acid cotransporter 7
VYTIFCKTFLKGSDAKIGDVFIMIGCVLLVLLFLMVLSWISMLVLFPNDPKIQAVGLFACTHKTVAVGVPLISSIYADSPMLGLYVLPLLIWYPTQLVLGTALAPYLAKYIERREKELNQQLDVEAWLHGRGDNSQFPPYLTQDQSVLDDMCYGADEQFEPNESQAIGTV